MNRNKLIAFLLTIVILSSIIGVVAYLLSFRTITFSVSREDLTLNVYTSADRERKNKIAEIKNGDTLRLQEASYQAIPTNKDYDELPLYFNVEKGDKTVELKPSYSNQRLESLLEADLPAIQTLLASTYPQVNSGFELAKGQLYREGQWYATTLTQIPESRGDIGDIYHVIMLKKDGKWSIIDKPTLVLTTATAKDVPLDILQDANRMGD